MGRVETEVSALEKSGSYKGAHCDQPKQVRDPKDTCVGQPVAYKGFHLYIEPGREWRDRWVELGFFTEYFHDAATSHRVRVLKIRHAVMRPAMTEFRDYQYLWQ